MAGARPVWEAELYDLLAAYAQQRQKRVQGHISVGHRVVWSLVEAREALRRLVGEAGDWTAIDPYLTRYMTSHGLPARAMSATVRASALSAMLEMVQGRGARPAPGRMPSRRSISAAARRGRRPCRWRAGTRHDDRDDRALRGRG